jgi:hypothetical protein
MRSQGRLSPRDESGTRPKARGEGQPPPPRTAALDARRPRRRGQDAPIRRQAPAPMTSFGSGTSISPSVAPHRPAHGPRRGPILRLACRNLQTQNARACVARRRCRAAAPSSRPRARRGPPRHPPRSRDDTDAHHVILNKSRRLRRFTPQGPAARCRARPNVEPQPQRGPARLPPQRSPLTTSGRPSIPGAGSISAVRRREHRGNAPSRFTGPTSCRDERRSALAPTVPRRPRP